MNERNKKVYAIVIAILFILSIATSFIPSISVKADTAFPLSTLNNIIPTSDLLFTQSLYDNGLQNSDLSEYVLKNVNSNIFAPVNTSNLTRWDQFCDWLDDRSSSQNQIAGGASFNNINLSLYSGTSYEEVNNWLLDGAPDAKVVIVNTIDNFFQIYIYKAIGNSFVSNYSGGYIDTDFEGQYNGVIINITNSGCNIGYNNSERSPLVTTGNYKIAYSTLPIYLPFVDNGYVSTNNENYSSINTPSVIWNDYLDLGVTSPFIFDRRTLFSNYVPEGFDVNSDPLSQDNVGVYDFDFYPSGGVTSGVYVIDNLQLSAKTSEMEDVNLYALISYNFTCNNGYYSTVTAFPIVENYILKNMNTKISQYGIISSNNLETSIPLDDTSYQTFSARSILRDSGPVDEGKRSYYVEDKTRRSISMLHLYGISDFLQLISPSQTSPKTIVQSSGAVTNFTVACSIKIDYGNGETSSTLGTIVYDYFTGQSIKSGLTSTDNNTPLDDISSTVQSQLNDINSGGFNGGVGGNTVNGGNNSNVNNPSFVNNNNPSITINNNNGLTEPDGLPDNPSESSFSMLWSIWESYHFAEWLNQDLEGNGFLHYIFSSQIWELPVFNLIIPALAIIITVSIASTIIRFIRGN